MNPLIFAGDTHGSLSHLADVPPRAHVIHVGDFAPLGQPLEQALPAELHHRFWFVPGNHDFDRPEHFDNLHTAFAQDRNFHLKVISIGGLRIAGLGGVFSLKTWWPKESIVPGVTDRAGALRATPRRDRFRDGLTLKQRRYVFREDFDALATLGANVLVTHEAPTTHRHGFAGIDELARRLGVHTIVHGHHHVDYQAEIAGTTQPIRVIGVGLRGLTDINGTIYRPGEERGQNA